jgi:hypothetical protein
MYTHTYNTKRTGVGAGVGARVGDAVGACVGARVGEGVGSAVGTCSTNRDSVSKSATETVSMYVPINVTQTKT